MQAFGYTGEMHHHTVPIRQLGVHLAFNKGESRTDAAIVSRKIAKATEVINFPGGGNVLCSIAAGADAGDGKPMMPALVIQGAFAKRCRTVVGSGPAPGPSPSRKVLRLASGWWSWMSTREEERGEAGKRKRLVC